MAEYGTRTVEWESRLNDLFSTFSTSEDEKLGTQIVKVTKKQPTNHISLLNVNPHNKEFTIIRREWLLTKA